MWCLLRLPGWKYCGSFIEGKSRPCDDWDLGEMWECPFFVCLPEVFDEEQSSEGQHLLPLEKELYFLSGSFVYCATLYKVIEL